MEEFLPILLQAVVAIGFAAFALTASVLLGRSGRRNATKDSPYECGVPTDMAPSPRFSVKFYLVAMLFILFDIEIVFMYPWAVAFQDYIAESGTMILWSMLCFVGILMVGYLYAWKKGVFSWNT